MNIREALGDAQTLSVHNIGLRRPHRILLGVPFQKVCKRDRVLDCGKHWEAGWSARREALCASWSSDHRDDRHRSRREIFTSDSSYFVRNEMAHLVVERAVDPILFGAKNVCLILVSKRIWDAGK
jgi:hypothetical protein